MGAAVFGASDTVRSQRERMDPQTIGIGAEIETTSGLQPCARCQALGVHPSRSAAYRKEVLRRGVQVCAVGMQRLVGVLQSLRLKLPVLLTCNGCHHGLLTDILAEWVSFAGSRSSRVAAMRHQPVGSASAAEVPMPLPTR